MITGILSGAPISAALALAISGGGPISLTPASVTHSWVMPGQSLNVTGGAFIACTTGQTDTNGATTTAQDSTGATFALIAVAYIETDAALGAGQISDSKGNTWTPLTTRLATTGGNTTTAHKFFYKANPVVGTGHTASVTKPGSAGIYPTIALVTFRGVATVSPFNVQNGNPGNGAGLTSVNVGSISANATDVAIVGLTHAEVSTAGIAGPSGFTIPTNGAVATVAGVSFGLVVGYKLNAGTVTNPTFTGASDIRSAAIASFIQASAGLTPASASSSWIVPGQTLTVSSGGGGGTVTGGIFSGGVFS